MKVKSYRVKVQDHKGIYVDAVKAPSLTAALLSVNAGEKIVEVWQGLKRYVLGANGQPRLCK